MNGQKYVFVILKKPELNVVTTHARGVQNREDTKCVNNKNKVHIFI